MFFVDLFTWGITFPERDEKGEWSWGFMLLQDDEPEPFLHTYVPPSERSLSRNNSSILPSVTYGLEDVAKQAQTSSGFQLPVPGMLNPANGRNPVMDTSS